MSQTNAIKVRYKVCLFHALVDVEVAMKLKGTEWQTTIHSPLYTRYHGPITEKCIIDQWESYLEA